MTFPAWFELHRDAVIIRHPACSAVYANILNRPNAFHDPQEVKAWLIAEQLGFEKKTVIAALNLLVARGYLAEHARGFRRVRRFTIAITRTASMPNDTASAG